MPKFRIVWYVAIFNILIQSELKLQFNSWHYDANGCSPVIHSSLAQTMPLNSRQVTWKQWATIYKDYWWAHGKIFMTKNYLSANFCDKSRQFTWKEHFYFITTQTIMSYDMSKVLFSPLFSTYISERIKMIFFCRIRLDLKFWLDLSQQPLLLSVTMRDKPDFPVVPRQIRLAKKYTLL